MQLPVSSSLFYVVFMSNVFLVFRCSRYFGCFLAINQDQMWGIISRRIAHQSAILDVDDVIAAISSELTKPTIKDWVGSRTRISVKKLDATRSWRSHLPGTGVRLEGGLLKDESGNHLFLCMQRRGHACPICSIILSTC